MLYRFFANKLDDSFGILLIAHFDHSCPHNCGNNYIALQIAWFMIGIEWES